MPSVEQVYRPFSVSNSLAHQRFASRLPRRFCFPEALAGAASLACGSNSTSLNMWRRVSDVPASSSSLSLCRTVRRLTAPTTSCVRGDTTGSMDVTAVSLCGDASASSVEAAAGRIHCCCSSSCREQHCWLVPSILPRLVARPRGAVAVWPGYGALLEECVHHAGGIACICMIRQR